MSLKHLAGAVAFIVALNPGAARGAEITLTAVADTSLWQRDPARNLGGSDLLPAGAASTDANGSRSRLLLRFALAAIPAGATIESATLSFTVVRAPSLPAEKPVVSSTFTLRRTLKDWGEGDKTYTDPQKPMTSTQNATAGETTWLYRFFGDESKRWTVGGGDINDGDFAEDSSGSFFVGTGPGGTYAVHLNATGLQDIRDWVADASQNFGWMLKSEAEQSFGSARIFGSRESVDPAVRPQLTIIYSVSQPDPPQIQSILRQGAGVTVRFTAQANVVYRPQHRLRVHAGDWTDLPTLGPLSSDGTLEFTDDLTGVDERYYRVMIP